MRRFWKHDDDLEARLREHRAEPRAEFFIALADRLARRRPLRRLQIAIAASLTICVVAIFAAVGGVGYTAASVGSLATSLSSSQSVKQGESNQQANVNKPQQGEDEKNECDAKKTPAGKQYCDDNDNDDEGGNNGGGGGNNGGGGGNNENRGNNGGGNNGGGNNGGQNGH